VVQGFFPLLSHRTVCGEAVGGVIHALGMCYDIIPLFLRTETFHSRRKPNILMTNYYTFEAVYSQFVKLLCLPKEVLSS